MPMGSMSRGIKAPVLKPTQIVIYQLHHFIRTTNQTAPANSLHTFLRRVSVRNCVCCLSHIHSMFYLLYRIFCQRIPARLHSITSSTMILHKQRCLKIIFFDNNTPRDHCPVGSTPKIIILFSNKNVSR